MNEYGIVANVISDRVLRTGAKVWICYCNGDAECPRVVGMTKGGRIVMKYTHYKRLENFRAAWCPQHLRDRVFFLFSKDKAGEWAATLDAMWKGVRYFDRDGTLLRDGVATSEAFRREIARRRCE